MIEPVAIPRHPGTSRSLWAAAATVAVSLHLAFAALAYVYTQREMESDDLGAPGIEIALELASPQTQPSDLPPGPDVEASVASSAVAEQRAEVKEADLKETPVDTERADQQVRVDTKDKPDDEKSGRQGQDPGVRGIGCTGGDCISILAGCGGSAEGDHDRPGHRREPSACARDLAARVARAFRQTQEIPFRPQPEGGTDSPLARPRSNGAGAVRRHRRKFGR